MLSTITSRKLLIHPIPQLRQLGSQFRCLWSHQVQLKGKNYPQTYSTITTYNKEEKPPSAQRYTTSTRRSYCHTHKQSMVSKVYDVNETNISISEQEQERIKATVTSTTGTEETHIRMLKDLDRQVELLHSLQTKYDQKYKCSDGNDINNDHQDEDTKILIQQMQKVASEYTNLGMLEDAKVLQEDILQRLIDFHTKKDNFVAASDEGGEQTKTSTNNGIPEHIDIAKIMHDMGSVQSRMNHPIDAKKWFDASLSIKQSILCDTLGYAFHYEIGKTLNGLALVAVQEGSDDIMEIIQLFQSAEENYIHHGESLINDKNNDIENDDGEVDVLPMENSLTLVEEYSGDSMEDHPHITSINSNLAMVYRNNGDFSMALQKYQEALRVQRLWTLTDNDEGETNCSSTNSNLNVINLLMDIGDCYQATEKYEEALGHYEEALRLHMITIRKESQKRQSTEQESKSEKDNKFVKDSVFQVMDPMNDAKVSPIEGILRHNIGLMNANLGQFDDAMTEYQSSLRIKKMLDENNPEVAKTLNAIGALEATKGDYASAKAFFREALKVYRMNTTTISGMDEDSDEGIFQTKRNIELIERQLGGFRSR